jgi:hypothetical protein
LHLLRELELQLTLLMCLLRMGLRLLLQEVLLLGLTLLQLTLRLVGLVLRGSLLGGLRLLRIHPGTGCLLVGGAVAGLARVDDVVLLCVG